jgi:hypothetical protein
MHLNYVNVLLSTVYDLYIGNVLTFPDYAIALELLIFQLQLLFAHINKTIL